MKPLFLLGVRDGKPQLDEDDSVIYEHPFHEWRLIEEQLMLPVRAIAHHPLDSGAVVPGTIHEHDLTLGW